MPGDLNRGLSRPPSELSLTLPTSFSEMEEFSNQNSFKIGMFAALIPRPTVRYDNNPRYASGKQPAQSKISIQKVIQEVDPFSNSRIDELADNLGSGDLRDLLERDKRRRERKREADKAKLQRKLERRAERQREEEFRRGRVDNAEPTTPSRTKVSVNSELRSSPPTTDTAVQTNSSPLPNVERESISASTNPFTDPMVTKSKEFVGHIRNPFEDEKDLEPDHFGRAEDQEPPLPARSPLRNVQPTANKPRPTLSPPTSPLQRPVDRTSLSQASMLGRETTPDIPEDSELDKPTSDQSVQFLSSWTTFFRKGGRGKGSSVDKGRTTPDFSNTSRESFQRQQPSALVPPRSFRRADSGTPQRTLSKFREDLPELPISPPDSRVQSPEASIMPTTSGVSPQPASRQTSQSLSGTVDSKSLATSSSIPMLDQSRHENRLSQKQSVELDTAEAGSLTVLLPQSLASVDSEGSWLSGKPVKRASGQTISPLRQSRSSLRPHVPGEFERREEADDLETDEYLDPALEKRESLASAGRKASSIVTNLDQESGQSSQLQLPDRSDETWHNSIGRQAKIVRQATRAKSKEGLLNDFKAEEADDSSADEDASLHGVDTAAEEFTASPIMEAESVEYKGRVRHISAGSARLLDIHRCPSQVESRSSGGNKGGTTLSNGREQQREELRMTEAES
jgi:hypothetical protein